MKQLISRFIRNDEGQDLVEYAFLVAFIALLVTVGLTALSTGLNTYYSGIGAEVGGATIPAIT